VSVRPPFLFFLVTSEPTDGFPLNLAQVSRNYERTRMFNTIWQSCEIVRQERENRYLMEDPEILCGNESSKNMQLLIRPHSFIPFLILEYKTSKWQQSEIYTSVSVWFQCLMNHWS
jgi:hypothetical protein